MLYDCVGEISFISVVSSLIFCSVCTVDDKLFYIISSNLYEHLFYNL